MMNKYYSRFTLIMIILSACNISKNIDATGPALPVTFRNAAEAAGTSNVGDIPWKTFFTDVALQNLINSAIAKNYDLQVAIRNIEAAQLIVEQVKWNYVPGAGVNINAASTRSSDNSITKQTLSQNNLTTKHIEDYSANISVAWEADIWGKIRNQNKNAVAAYLQTKEAKNAIQTSIILRVSQGYYNLLMLDNQLRIAKKNVSLNDSTLFITKLQFDAGQVTSLAVDQVRAQQMAASELVPQFEKEITLQENALQILAGELPGDIVRKSTLNDIYFNERLSAGLPASLVSRRPDVRSRELALVIANANVGIQKSEMYPALRITAQGGINSFKASNWFNVPASLFGVVAGSVFQPLLNHKVAKTQYEVAKVNREITVIQFRQSVLTAVGEVSDALVEIEKLKVQQDITATRVRTLQQATANARMLFQNGMANYLEVITAQSNVLESELELAAVKKQWLSAVSKLYVALGGGWK